MTDKGIMMLDRILVMVEEINSELHWLEELPTLTCEQADRWQRLTIKHETIKEIMGMM
jgi:hypothetical protein